MHLEYLQAVLKEFNPTGALNEITLIRYFQEGLRLSIRAQLDHQGQDLNTWEEVVEKSGNVETKANLQPPFYVRDINIRCPKGHRLSAKKDKEHTYWEPRNEVSKDKAKSNSSASANQPQTQAPKKDKCGRRGGHPATGVNATEIAKKDKALKDLSYIKCYTYYQTGHYTTKCPDKPKN